LEKECKEHHKRFFTFHNKKRPYIILKWAETSDGFIAPEIKKEAKPVWITNELSRQLVHKWRTEEQAILVGSNTVIQDNPSLTARDWEGQNPVRIVLDPDESLSKKLNVFNNDAKTIVISRNELDYSKNVARQICDILYLKDINSVIIEGGAQTLQTFIDSNLWDEARVFIGQKEFKKGIKAPIFKGRLMSERIINSDILKFYLND
jgi:diaminohydroxyphosphoribosylaminopyrimidine deaminase/5-amino-6-(5-phosphoribosylamino)uracil reductase